MIAYIRRLLMNIAIPAGKLIAKISRPECETTTAQFLDLKQRLEDGDLLVSYVGWELSNYFIPGTFKHVGVYHQGWVYESTTHGTRRVTLEEFFFKKDKIGLVRPLKKYAKCELDRGVHFMIENLGEPYDYGFGLAGSSAWYCSKFVRAFFIAMDPGFEQQFTLREILGEPTVQPDDFWLASKFFRQVTSYNLG